MVRDFIASEGCNVFRDTDLSCEVETVVLIPVGCVHQHHDCAYQGGRALKCS